MEKEKLSYTAEEIKVLLKWFEGKTYPKDMWVDDCTHLLEPEETVKKLIHLIEINSRNKNFLGYIILLDKIRLKLISIEEKEGNPDSKNA